jgi:hypothetical protein
VALSKFAELWLFRSLVLVGLVFLSACDGLRGEAPEDVVVAYLEAVRDGNYSVAYDYVSGEDRRYKSLAEVVAENKPINGPWKKILSETVTFVAGDVRRTDGGAVVAVDITRPSTADIVRGVMRGAASEAGLDPKKIPLETTRESFRLKEEGDRWVVVMGWRVDGLIAQARDLRAKNDLLGAAEKYTEALAVDAGSVKAADGLEEVNEETRLLNEKTAYLSQVQLYDLSGKYYSTYRHDRMPGVDFKLKNMGDRSLDEVEVTVYFEDVEGSVIHEDSFHPVLVTKYSIRDSKPLKPNYVWQMEKGKFYMSKAVPEEWKEGDLTAQITDIRFSE